MKSENINHYRSMAKLNIDVVKLKLGGNMIGPLLNVEIAERESTKKIVSSMRMMKMTIDMKAEMKRIGEQMRDAPFNLIKLYTHIREHKVDRICPVCMDYVNISSHIADTLKKLEAS